jgi:hypothetical protein
LRAASAGWRCLFPLLVHQTVTKQMTTPRDTLKRRYGPGFWEDAEGGLHVSIPELLQVLNVRDTPENRAEATKFVEEFMRKQGIPEVRIVHREEPDA